MGGICVRARLLDKHRGRRLRTRLDLDLRHRDDRPRRWRLWIDRRRHARDEIVAEPVIPRRATRVQCPRAEVDMPRAQVAGTNPQPGSRPRAMAPPSRADPTRGPALHRGRVRGCPRHAPPPTPARSAGPLSSPARASGRPRPLPEPGGAAPRSRSRAKLRPPRGPPPGRRPSRSALRAGRRRVWV